MGGGEAGREEKLADRWTWVLDFVYSYSHYYNGLIQVPVVDFTVVFTPIHFFVECIGLRRVLNVLRRLYDRCIYLTFIKGENHLSQTYQLCQVGADFHEALPIFVEGAESPEAITEVHVFVAVRHY